MTSFTNLTNTNLDIDKPITRTIARALRDNPLAIAEGDATAPRISTQAIRVELGNILGYGDYTSNSVNSTSDVKFKGVSVPYQGDYRIVFNISANGGATSFARIYVNGTAAGTEITVGAGGTLESTQDILSLQAGDVIEIRGRAVGAATCTNSKLECRHLTGTGFVKV